jgi:hypothetical protein
LGELEAALDIGARRLPVALPLVAARAATQDLGAQPVAREPGTIGELEREREEREGVRDRRDREAAAAEAEQRLGTVDVGELRPG